MPVHHGGERRDDRDDRSRGNRTCATTRNRPAASRAGQDGGGSSRNTTAHQGDGEREREDRQPRRATTATSAAGSPPSAVAIALASISGPDSPSSSGVDGSLGRASGGAHHRDLAAHVRRRRTCRPPRRRTAVPERAVGPRPVDRLMPLRRDHAAEPWEQTSRRHPAAGPSPLTAIGIRRITPSWSAGNLVAPFGGTAVRRCPRRHRRSASSRPRPTSVCAEHDPRRVRAPLRSKRCRIPGCRSPR